MKLRTLKLLAALILILTPLINGTNAYFTDTVTLDGISISTGCWTPPTVPIHISPGDGTSLNEIPTLSWQASSSSCGDETIAYEVKIVGDIEKASYSYTSEWQFTTSLVVPDLPDGTYQWQVRAKDSEDYISEYSIPWIFTIKSQVSNTPVVVINEVMWMGSTAATTDEWIELRNMTDQPIDVGNWVIQNAKERNQGNKQDYKINPNTEIPANGYLIIANYPKTSANSSLNISPDITGASISLSNDNNDHLILKNKNGEIVDQAKGDHWPKGTNTPMKKSMERKQEPGDGLAAENWLTSTYAGSEFWKTENNYGTPGAANSDTIMQTKSLSIIKPIETNLTLSVSKNRETADLTISGDDLPNFTTASYLLTYFDDETPKTLTGLLTIDGNKSVSKTNIDLGTCSNGVCIYAANLKKVLLEVTLSNEVIVRYLQTETSF